jgi:squalene-hopene/tetraprenyl-beta-curcumene cyclase
MRQLRRVVAVVAAVAAIAGCGEEKKAAGGAPPSAAKTASPMGAPEMRHAQILASYDKGLDFLLTKQKDGIWSVQGRPHAGFTGLAITPFLDRPGGVRESDKPVAEKALKWIASQLAEDGGIKAPESSNYETSVVVMALAASKDAAYKDKIAKAAAYIKSLQFVDEKDKSYGGIGYGDDGPVSDLSNTQYALNALAAAGVPKDDPLYQKALVFLQRTQNRKENEAPGEPTEWKDANGKKVVRGNDGGAAYAPGNGEHTGYDTAPDGTQVLRSYGSMTYALLRCYHLAGLDEKDGRVKAAVDWISKHWTVEANPGMPEANKKDGLYYYYAAIGKTLPAMGIDRITLPDGKSVDWRVDLSKKLMADQTPGGDWINAGPRWMESDPVLATSYALTALGACAR